MIRESMLRVAGTSLLIVLWAVSCGASADVKPGHARYRTYGPSDGIPNIYILSLLQDRHGFLWAGTENGVYRFDGARFQAYGLRDGLQSTSISRMLEDDDGTLWVGTSVGLHRWTGQRFVANTAEQGLANEKIWALATGPQGLWGITLAPGTGPQSRNESGVFAPVGGWTVGTATALTNEPGTHRMWLGVWDGAQAHVANWENGKWERFELPSNESTERIEKLVFDGAGNLWARRPNGLVMKPPGAPFQRVETPLPANSRSGFLLPGGEGDIYVPTSAGLLHHDKGRWSVIEGPDHLSSPWSRTVLRDREGSLWWGSAGLHRRLGRGVWTAYTAREGLPGDVVWSIVRDREQRLWVATNNGLARLTSEGFRRVSGTEARDIRTVAQLPDGRLVAGGSMGAELLLVDPASNAATLAPFAGVDSSVRVMRLHVDRQGTLWAATSDGLHHAGASMALPIFARASDSHGATEGLVGDVREDGQGRLWVAGQHGLSVRDADRWHTFDSAHGLRRAFVSHVLPTASGEILVSYYDPLGVSYAEYANGTFRVVRHKDGDSGGIDSVYMLEEDARKRVWVGGSQGVQVLSGRTGRSFGLDDGLVGEDIASAAFFADPNGEVWIGTSAGLAHFDAAADDRLTSLPPPPVAFLDVQLGARAVLPTPDPLSVPYRDNVMEARLAGLSFSAGRALQFRTQLVGQDTEPYIARSPVLRYAELAPGAYTLEAAARVAPHEPWGPVSRFAFAIEPAWWQTLTFKMALAALACLLLRQMLRWRTAFLFQRNLELETQVHDRTTALQAAVAQLSAEVIQRSAAEEALALANSEERRRTERFSLIANIASVLSSNLDIDPLIRYATQSLQQVIGCEFVEIPLVDRPGWKRERHSKSVLRVHAHSLDVAIQLGEELLGAIRVGGSRAFDDLDVKSMEIVADYLAVAIKNARLFSEAKDVAIVSERQRVAHDLHDNVTQILAAMRMRAQTLVKHSRGQSDTVTRHADRLAELAQIAVAEMRAFLDQLRPHPSALEMAGERGEYLRDRSLSQAVDLLLSTAVPDNIQTVCDFRRFPAQSIEREEALFRLCQEAVSNAVRHSGARTLEVIGFATDSSVAVHVVDDGCGIPGDVDTGGMGLASMRQRITALGGSLRLRDRETGGTVVEAELPRVDRHAFRIESVNVQEA